MPRISEKQMITSGFEALCANPDFPYSMDDLMSWVLDTSFRYRFVEKETLRPVSGYNVFFKETRSSFEKVSELGAYWSSLSKEDKDQWNFKASEENSDKGNYLETRRKRGPSSWNRFLTSQRDTGLSFAQKRELWTSSKTTK